MKLDLLWIRHAESLSNIDIYNFNIHPSLSYNGLLQSIELGKKISKMEINDVYCSASLRTILTSIISISFYNLLNINKKKIKIIPYISEINRIIDNLNCYDDKYINVIKQIIIEKYNNQNKILNPNELCEISKISINWLNSNIINFLLKDKIILLLKKNNSIDKYIINKIKNNNDERYLREKISSLLSNNIKNKEDILQLLNFKIDLDLIDFSYLINENDKGYITDKNEIYNFLYNINDNKEKKKILLFSHKYFINCISSKKYLLKNCEIYNENIELVKKENLEKYILKKKKIEIKKISVDEKVNIKNNDSILENLQKNINKIIN
jgi:hypothetical protein